MSQTDQIQPNAEPAGLFSSAGVGAVISLLLGWIPLIGPIIPGIAAGYLRGKNKRESAAAAALGNTIALLPLGAIMALFFGFGTLGLLLDWDGEAAVGIIFLLFFAVLAMLYYIGLGALGGVLGAGITNRGEPK